MDCKEGTAIREPLSEIMTTYYYPAESTGMRKMSVVITQSRVNICRVDCQHKDILFELRKVKAYK